MNTIFDHGYEDIEIWIHEKCAKSIADLVYLKEAADGTKLKEKVKNPDTGQTYEKYGHCSDSLDYFICQAFINEFIKFQKGGAKAVAPTAGKSLPSKGSY
jgi:phage terminase large subunit